MWYHRRMARRARSRSLRGTQVTGNWWDKHEDRVDGKVCKITHPASLSDVKECVRVCKGHFFEPGTLRFFNSRVGSRAYADGKGGAYFATSERGPHGPRRGSVRHYSPGRCGVETIGEFMQYPSMAAADRAAARLAGPARRR